MSSYKFTPRAVASPDAPQKSLVRKRARSGGANWVQVTREKSASKAKRPRTAGSQQPACTHKEHDILTTAEATAFAAQFWDRKTHPTKASQHEYYYGLTDMSTLTIQHVVRNKQRFVRKLRILKRSDFWNVYKWLAGAYRSSASHTDHQQQPVLIRDDKVKWLDFGSTPDPVTLQPHPGYVWLKSGYSEAIPWRKVGLIKQRNVDLTTDGLWAMPLNEGWVPVKARRLQDWQKLKKYVPVHKQGDVCPNGVPALPEKSNADSDSDSE